MYRYSHKNKCAAHKIKLKTRMDTKLKKCTDNEIIKDVQIIK